MGVTKFCFQSCGCLYLSVAIAIFVLFNSVDNTALAQSENPPPVRLPVPPTREDLPEPIPRVPPPEELLPQQPPTVPEDVPSIPGTITIKEFDFIGNTAFSDQQLAAVTQPYTNRPISFSDLITARTAVTQLYVDNGYITSGAFIPPQAIEDGIVKIAISEGALEETNIRVEGRLNPSYVRDRLALATATPLNVPRLVAALRLLQLNPLIETVEAELASSPRSGQSILDVEVVVADSFDTQIILDNNRSPSVGSFRQTVEIEEANLLGYGDQFLAAYRNTDGSDDFEVAYDIPLNARNGTLRLSYRTASSEVIEAPFDRFDLNSQFSRYELTLRQPVLQTPNQELTLGVSIKIATTETTLADEPADFVAGADEQGKTQLSILRFTQEWLNRGQENIFAARSEISLGIDAFGATINEQPPDGRYFAWRGQAQWARLLATDTLLLARADIQLSDRPLVSLEQFGLGGIGSVRGYRQDVIFADNGALASVEIRLPVFRSPSQEMLIQIVPFADLGTVWSNSSAVAIEENTLASLGIGLNYEIGDRFSARIDWAVPLIDIDSSSSDGTLQENGIYFSIIYVLF